MIKQARGPAIYAPTSLEMEENLCYLLLATETAWRDIQGIILPDDLSDTACRAILTTAYRIAEEGGTPWDLVEYMRRLANHIDFPAPNGFSVWVARVARKYQLFTYLAKQYATELAELAGKRREFAAAERALEEARRTGANVSALLASELEAVKTTTARVPYQTVMDTIDAIVSASASPDERKKPVPTGLGKVDGYLGGGARPGQFITLAACTGIGKSAFALQWCDDLAKSGRRSIYFSLEMPAADLHVRLLAARTGISTDVLSSGQGLTEEMRRKLVDATAHTEKITVIDDVRRSVWELRNPILDIDPHLVVIDYLQLLPTDPRLENRQLQVSANCRALKELAMSIRKPLVVLAQLSRQAEGAEPLLSHLRESGDIENTSDVVIFLHRPRDPHVSEAALILAKNRNGQTGRVPMVWRGKSYRYDVAETRSGFDDAEADGDDVF